MNPEGENPGVEKQSLPNDLDSVQEEATRINEDVDQLKQQKENAKKDFNELALLASQERDFNFSIFSDEPKFFDRLRLSYRREFLPNSDLTVFVDPALDDSQSDTVKGFLEYLQAPELKTDIEKTNKYLPDSYNQITQMPSIFIHSETSGTELLKVDKSGGAFVWRPLPKDTREEDQEGKGSEKAEQEKANINLVIDEKENPNTCKSAFIHEIVHNSEPKDRRFYLRLFAEGIATNIEQIVRGKSGDAALIFGYSLSKGQDHPLVKGSLPANKPYHFNLKELFTPEAQGLEARRIKKEHIDLDVATRYYFAASFLGWCRWAMNDPKLSFLDRSVKEESNVKNLGIVTGLSNEDGEFYEDAQHIRTPLFNLAFNPQECKEWADRAQKLRFKSEEGKAVFSNFMEEFSTRLDGIGEKYNRHLNSLDKLGLLIKLEARADQKSS